MRHVSDHERRARLGTRHGLAPGCEAGSVDAATRSIVALHATEAPTVYLSCWARVPEVAVADVDRAIYEDRSVVRQLAMRRTLWGFPRDLLPAIWPSASARVAAVEAARLAKDIVAGGVAPDGTAWVDAAGAGVLAELARHPGGLPAADIRQAVPMIDERFETKWGTVNFSSRVLTVLGARAEIVRGDNVGGWHVSRPRWTLTEHWLAEAGSLGSTEGYRRLVGAWLRSFGPGTEDDLVWWLGATKGIVRDALAALGAEPASLDDGSTGWLLPDDLDEVAAPDPGVALLPVLDPTVMGWKQRDFHLGPHRDAIFDRNGNAGTTAWVDGRVVGCWVQDDTGRVRVNLLEPIPARARKALDAEAERLTAWLDGLQVPIIYKSPAMKAALAS
ncbi:MAG: winged helix DNA-binding domain-containing protein [Acidimicrobiales bacterium]